LRDAGITVFPTPALDWLAQCGPTLPQPYALVVPGTSPTHGGAKRWPIDRFAAIATLLAARGITPVVIGGARDAAAAATIRAACPAARDMTGRTTLQELAGIAARAAVTIGGDTGPVHLAAVAGSPVVALFSRYSIPAQAAPRGPHVVLLQEDVLTDLPVDRVAAAIAAL